MKDDNADNPIKPEPNRKPDGTFGPGNIANPNGRPRKEHSLTDAMKQKFIDKPDLLKQVTDKAFEMAIAGDITALKLVWNYMDGMPQQSTDITSGHQPIPLLTGVINVPSDDSTSQT